MEPSQSAVAVISEPVSMPAEPAIREQTKPADMQEVSLVVANETQVETVIPSRPAPRPRARRTRKKVNAASVEITSLVSPEPIPVAVLEPVVAPVTSPAAIPPPPGPRSSVEARRVWSRAVVNQVREPGLTDILANPVPGVRSTAAMRARAGAYYKAPAEAADLNELIPKLRATRRLANSASAATSPSTKSTKAADAPVAAASPAPQSSIARPVTQTVPSAVVQAWTRLRNGAQESFTTARTWVTAHPVPWRAILARLRERWDALLHHLPRGWQISQD
jgi:hypothetical protein